MAVFPTSVVTLTNPVSTDTLASPSHSGQHSTINDEMEAVQTFLLDSWADVRSYGATGDGATDDAAAIQSAIAAADAIYFPAGEYRIATELIPKGHTIYRGAGRGVTIIQADGCSGFLRESAVPDADGSLSAVTIENMTIRGDYTADMVGISLKHTHSFVLKDLDIENFGSHGIMEQANYVGSMHNLRIRYNDGDGIYQVDGANAITMVDVHIRYNNGYGFHAAGTAPSPSLGTRMFGVTIEQNALGGAYAETHAHNMALIGCYLERNKEPQAGTGRTPPIAPVVGFNVKFGSDAGSTIRGGGVMMTTMGECLGSGGTGYDIWFRQGSGQFLAGNWHVQNATLAVYHDPDAGNFTQNVAMPTIEDLLLTNEMPRRGVSTFNGTTGRVITHNIGKAGHKISIVPTAAIVGHIYVSKGAASDTIYSSEATDTGAFDWTILMDV